MRQVSVAADRIRACLVLGALGDALGAPIEFDSLDAIRRRHGPEGLTEPEPCYGHAVAITDDTQMTLFTAEGLVLAAREGALRDRDALRRHLHRAYLRWLRTQDGLPEPPGPRAEPARWGWLLEEPGLRARRAPGNTCLSALQGGAMGTPDRRLNGSKGCGGVMRVAPVGLVVGLPDVFRAGCDAAAITHGHPSGWLAAGAFALLVAELARGAPLASALAGVEEELRQCPDSGECLEALRRAHDEAEAGPPHAEAVERVGAGWVAEEALAVAVYAVAGEPDPRRALLLSVNHGGDSDSTGALCGNLLGAMHGQNVLEAVPGSWLQGLELREVIESMARDLSAIDSRA